MTGRPTSPRESVEAMAWAFRTRARDLFEATRPIEYREYNKGLYGIQYVKPSKHVARLLSVDREIVAICTSFTDLQQRTIQLAIEVIDGSGGRLENTVAIVMHRDSHGNGKLKNWGREDGLTVIPIYMPDYDLLSGQELERLLLTEFYTHDPFDVTGPVSDDNQFYGRRDEAQDLARQLQGGQVRACLGIRKTGKTSIIHRVLSLVENYHASYTVMADCSRDAICQMDAPRLLLSIGAAVERAGQSEDYYSPIAPAGDECGLNEAQEFLTAVIREAPGPIVLVMDEVDYITPGSPTASHWKTQFNPFWRNLRAVYQELARTGPAFSVLVSGVSSKWFRVESIEDVENAALAFIPEEYLSPLSVPAGAAMVKSIGKTSGLLFDDQSATELASACSCVPFWIRKAGSFVHRNIELESRPRLVSLPDIKTLLRAFVEVEGAAIAETALTHLFRVYPELRSVAASSVGGSRSDRPPQMVNVLKQYGVLRPDGEVSGPMMLAGLELALSGRPAADSGASVVRFDSLDDWAEELAMVGARRNKLERRLRGIAVNFLRMDSLANRQKPSALERLLKALEEERRAALRSMSADEAVEKFLWTDLTRLIEREWALFQPIFNDKAAFSLNCATVNQRFDAHAKAADKADLALYRKALDWLELAISRMS